MVFILTVWLFWFRSHCPYAYMFWCPLEWRPVRDKSCWFIWIGSFYYVCNKTLTSVLPLERIKHLQVILGLKGQYTYVRKTYGPSLVGKRRDAFRCSSSCDLPPHVPAPLRPCRGQQQKCRPCWENKRLQYFVTRHLVGLADCHQVFPSKLLRRLRYGSMRFITQTPRYNSVNCLHPQR